MRTKPGRRQTLLTSSQVVAVLPASELAMNSLQTVACQTNALKAFSMSLMWVCHVVEGTLSGGAPLVWRLSLFKQNPMLPTGKRKAGQTLRGFSHVHRGTYLNWALPELCGLTSTDFPVFPQSVGLRRELHSAQ